MEDIYAHFVARYNYWGYIILMMIGLYAMIAKRNLVKKIIGMNIMQTAVILFYVSIGAKKGKTLPIIVQDHGDASHHAVQALDYINPLPHVLMLTAIVVSETLLTIIAILVFRTGRWQSRQA
mgnify:CR=1 FL=1